MSQQTSIEIAVGGLGYELVDVERVAGGLLRVTIDAPADDPAGEPRRAITVDDCEIVTRQLQRVLEVEGLSYERLEVSSPGLDRPLKKATDYGRFVGEQVEVTLKAPLRGRKRFRGELQARQEGWRLVLADPDAARVKPGRKPASATEPTGSAQEALDFSLDEVREARLVPVIDFKGRRGAAQDGAAPAGDDAPAEAEGGRIQ